MLVPNQSSNALISLLSIPFFSTGIGSENIKEKVTDMFNVSSFFFEKNAMIFVKTFLFLLL